jgi:colanic acid/amylovoran biosynthesis glycosyltransferase
MISAAMGSMRVLFTTYGFPVHSQAFVENSVLELVDAGVDMCVVASERGDHVLADRSGHSAAGSLTVIRAPWTDARARKVLTLAHALRQASMHHGPELRELAVRIHRQHGIGRESLARLYVLAPLLAWPADVVHLGWIVAAAQWIDLLPALDAPMVVSCRGSDLLIDPLIDGKYRARLARVFDRADCVHCVSHDLARAAIALGCEPAKLFVGAWGVDTRFFCPAREREAEPASGRDPERPLRIVSVGRLHTVKGYEFALAALRQLRRAGLHVEYTIIGTAEATGSASVVTAARDLDLEDCVTLRGVCPPDAVLEELRAADIFVLPSLSEGLSNATLEASAVGLPVVVTDVGGNREIVEHGVSGFVVPPRDTSSLTSALMELAGNPDLREKLGAQARRRVVEDFDIRLRSRALLEQYRRLIGAHDGPASPSAES